MEYINKRNVNKVGYFRTENTSLCSEYRVDGAIKFSRVWLISKEAKKPVDGRRKEFRHE